MASNSKPAAPPVFGYGVTHKFQSLSYAPPNVKTHPYDILGTGQYGSRTTSGESTIVGLSPSNTDLDGTGFSNVIAGASL
jgi:hypothetical protein